MAFVALTSLMGTIDLEFLQPNPRVSLDDETAKSLFEELSFLLGFLQSEPSRGAPIQDMETKIRDFALKAEDGIEVQLSSVILLAKDTEYQDKARKELHQTLREAAKDAEELLKIINNTSNECEAADDTHPSIHWLEPVSRPKNVVLDGSSPWSPKVYDHLNQCYFDSIHCYFFGDGHDVVSIFGMAGVGKTTLARRLYEDLSPAFDIQAWVTVPLQYGVRQMLCHLLQSMTPTVNKTSEESTVSQLQGQLYKCLKGKRYLVCLDDLWNTRVWDDIKTCLPHDSTGSRVFLTTQFYDVATYASSHCYYIREMDTLESDQSWDLFCKILSLKKRIAPEFEEIGKRVVEQCGGLPRSIVAVAERLSKCNYTLKEWKKIEKEIDSLGPLYSDAEFSSKLTLTYNQLPQHLKACFLYLAVFPKGDFIHVKDLIRLWIAEGFVVPLGHMALEDIAYEYLQQLIKRSLVLSSFSMDDKEMKFCRMHNALHSFCIQKAQEGGLFCAVNTEQCLGWSLNVLANSCRWLSLRSHSLDYYVLFNSNNPHSLLFFEGDLEMVVPFRFLRILDLSSSTFFHQKVSLHLTDFIFLKYLSIPHWFEGLNHIITSSYRSLQTLIVSGFEAQLSAPTLRLTSRIWESPHIRHLKLGNLYMVDPPSMVKEHLQTLSWASPTHFRKEVYFKFPNLKKLKIFYKDVLEPSHTRGCCRNPIIILENMEYLLQLETLTICVQVGSITLLERPMFPPRLKKLKLSGTNFPVKVLSVIGQLPELQELELKNAFYGRVWELAEGGFRKLKCLVIEARNLEQWVANASHFPELLHLVLRRCYYLEEIPRAFVEFPNFLDIQLERCCPSIVTSAEWIQKEREGKGFYTSIFVKDD